MKIAIDTRFYGTENGGLGRYTINFIKELAKLETANTYVLLLPKKYAGKLDLPPNFKQISVSARHYSLLEQLEVPYLLYKENVDLVHFLHFNAPVLFRGKYVVTIHDVLMHKGVGMAATTRSPLVYRIKRLAYRAVFDNAVKTAAHIFVPTQYVQKEVMGIYHIPAKKVTITYEGIDDSIKKSTSQNYIAKQNIQKPYFLYVGNAYPHKNLSVLIESVLQLNKVEKVHLVIVTPKNVFAERLLKTIELMDAKQMISVHENISDENLSELYSHATAFVFPSLSEGFGLPVLEAFSVGTLALVSDIPVFHEVYANAALYFDPNNVDSIVSRMQKTLTLSKEEKTRLQKRGGSQLKHYSWKVMVETLVAKYNAIK